MDYINKSEATAALRTIQLYLYSSTTELPATGITITPGELLVTKYGGSETPAAGVWTEVAGGVYNYECTITEVNTVGDLVLRINKSGILPTVNIVSVRNDVLAGDIDTFSPREAVSIMLAALAGKVSGAATNAPVFRSADDSANRITATTDASGNRTAITLNPSA